MNQINNSVLLAALLVGVAVAAATSYVAAEGLHWIPAKSEIETWRQAQAKQKAVRAQNGIDLQEFQSLLRQGVIVVDARPRAEFEKGHLLIDTVPPVLNVPSEAADPAQINRLMNAQQQTGFPMVLYCNSRSCDYADVLYRALEPFGFIEVKILLDGWEGIQKAGLPRATGPDTWTGFDEAGCISSAAAAGLARF